VRERSGWREGGWRPRGEDDTHILIQTRLSWKTLEYHTDNDLEPLITHPMANSDGGTKGPDKYTI
jgi:hypothetical protein